MSRVQRCNRMTRARSATVLGAIVFVAYASSCAMPEAPAPEAGVTDVSMEGIAFVPKSVTIRVGERVRWTNLEAVAIGHTTTSGDPGDADAGDLWDSGLLSPGESFTHQFNEAGTFAYFCVPHQNSSAMRDAVVIVEE